MAELNSISNIEKDETDPGCPKSVKNIQYLYLALIAILPFSLLLNALFNWVSTSYFLELLVPYFIFLSIYYGISRVKSWVVIFALLVSYWGVLRSIIDLLAQQPSDFSELAVSRTISAFYLCFFVYQIIVFSRKETKEYFGARGKVII